MGKNRVLFFNAVTTAFLFSTLTTPVKADLLSIQDYMTQVTGQHEGYKASKEAAVGAEKRSKEGRLLLRPFLYSNLSYRDDKAPTMTPAFMGTQTINKAYTLGIRQATSFGLTADLSYNLNFLKVSDAPLIPQPSVYTAYPYLQLSQSIWKNGFGSEVRANQRFLEASALATSHVESFKALQIRLEAETNYWLLALARESVQTQKEVFDRAQKILEWATRRSNLNLADKSDVLQAQAALEVRRFELQLAQDEEVNASHRFNLSRSVDHDTVYSELQRVDSERLRRSKAPGRLAMREDVAAAEQNERMATANADLALERNTPSLDVYANFAMNSSREKEMNEALGTSFQSRYPTTTVGLKFSTSLDFWSVADARSGFKKEKVAAERQLHRKMFEQERDWDDLNRKLSETQRRLSLSLGLEKAQKEKLVYEKERFKRGRTTTYQVLLFEQDYAQAQIGRIRAEGEVLKILSQMKLYGGSDS